MRNPEQPQLDAPWTALQLRTNLSRVLNPAVGARLLGALTAPGTDFAVIADILQGDPYIATKVVGLANHARRGQGAPIRTLDRAVQVLGLRQVRTLVLGVMLAGPLLSADGHVPRRRDLWRWVLACGVANDFLATHAWHELEASPEQPSAHLVTGLMLGLGSLILYAGLGTAYGEVLGTRLRPMTLTSRERTQLGVTRHDVTCWALQAMQCPEDMQQMPRVLSAGQPREQYLRGRAIEILAARIASFEVNDARAWLADGLPRLGLDPVFVDDQMLEMRSRLRELAGVFQVDLGEWQLRRATRQEIMVEAAQALQDLLIDRLTLRESLGLEG